jgi:hypothetical protein
MPPTGVVMFGDKVATLVGVFLVGGNHSPLPRKGIVPPEKISLPPMSFCGL